MNLEEAEHLIHEMANADASARASKVYRAAAGIVLGALAAERAKREEAERNYYTLCDAVCRESKGVEDACNQARAERAKREKVEAQLKTAVEALIFYRAEAKKTIWW